MLFINPEKFLTRSTSIYGPCLSQWLTEKCLKQISHQFLISNQAFLTGIFFRCCLVIMDNHRVFQKLQIGILSFLSLKINQHLLSKQKIFYQNLLAHQIQISLLVKKQQLNHQYVLRSALSLSKFKLTLPLSSRKIA